MMPRAPFSCAIVAGLLLLAACDSTKKTDSSTANALEVTAEPKVTPKPGGPVPIPYPNGVAVEKTDQPSSTSVKGQEVMLKNKSKLTQSTGD